MDAAVLVEELACFEQLKPGLLKTHLGQFALVKDKRLVGTFTTFEEAYEAGLAKFGNVPFLIKQILDQEPLHSIPALTYGLLRASL